MRKLVSFKTLYTATVILTLLLTAVMGVCGSPQSHTTPAVQVSSQVWSFGVMGDTQWTLATDPAGNNPGGVPVSIIDQINQQFINKGVKFVIQVGDLTENGNDADVTRRATAAQALYDAG
jgi:hypothetical protein